MFPLCPLLLTSLLGAAASPARAPIPMRQAQLAERAARDARLSFTVESARRARAVLEAAPAEGRDEVGERATALLALGCGGSGADVARIEARLENGEGAERDAALFALGELGHAGWPALERALDRDPAGHEEALCVGLALAARGGVDAAKERLQTLAAADGELARRASQALAHCAGEDPQGLAEMLALHYELRWRAGTIYGLVDGRRGLDARRFELFADDQFLDRVVLAAAADLPAAALRAHLTGMTNLGERASALRVAALVLPGALVHALETGACRPTPAGWQAVLSAIDARRSERRARELLVLAYRSSPELEPFAGRLLFRGGGDVPWTWVSEQIETGDPEQRALLVEACGERGEKERIPELVELIERPELGVAATARVALVRLGLAPAKRELDALLAGAPTPEREQALAAIARVLHDESLWRSAEQALKRADLPPDLRFWLLAGLAQNGAPVDKTELRAASPRSMDRARRQAWVRALSHRPEVEDLEALAEHFPLGDDFEVDVELALTLLAQRHPATGGLLSSALWGTDWNRSVLAGGLIVASAGPRGLVDELDGAPRTASELDLRRVGFALGEWGGLSALEPLVRRRTEGDPVLQGALLGALANRAESGGEVASPRPRVELQFPSGDLGGGGAAAPPKGKPKGKGKGKKGRSPFGG